MNIRYDNCKPSITAYSCSNTTWPLALSPIKVLYEYVEVIQTRKTRLVNLKSIELDRLCVRRWVLIAPSFKKLFHGILYIVQVNVAAYVRQVCTFCSKEFNFCGLYVVVLANVPTLKLVCHEIYRAFINSDLIF